MTKTEFMKKINLGTREIDAFGMKVKIRNLTVKEMLDVAAIEDETLNMLTMVSLAMVEPKLNVKEIQNMDSSAFNGIQKIIEAITPKG